MLESPSRPSRHGPNEAWSDKLARLPAQFQEDRAELLSLMREQAILRRSPTQPILSRDGSSARWMLNSLQVTLTARGATLAGRCMLELLKLFEGRQIATLGLTGVPLLNACVTQSDGRYHGLLVRHERKQHGSLKLIEGPIDPDEPTIVIDDSISSGLSMQRACDTLREAGIRVEGGIFLVRFGWHGGYSRMQAQGYRIEAVSDIWTDFIYHMDDEPKPIGNPTKIFPNIQWSDAQAPEKLHPADLARMAMHEYVKTGKLLRPPRELDSEYMASGGAWVSLRSQENIYVRHARDGFWHFPGEEIWPAPESVVRAAVKTVAELHPADALAQLDDSLIAVTFFTALEECSVGALDNDRYGIVVRSLERPGWMGGALPRMPGILNEWDQYQHARLTNGGLTPVEPHVIFRHGVVKAVQPGAVWQPTGVPAAAAAHPLAQRSVAAPVASRARALVLANVLGTDENSVPLADGMLPDDVDSLYVSIYFCGRLRGCYGTSLRHLDADVATLSDLALKDMRFAAVANAASADAIAVSVAFLYNRVDLGIHSVEDIVRRFRHGEHALMVVQEDRCAVFLPSVVSRHNLSAVSFAECLIHKAGIAGPPYRWIRFECISWLADSQGERLLSGSFVPEPPPASLNGLVDRLAPLGVSYLLQHQRSDGTFYTRYEPLQDQLYEGVDLPRLAHAAWVLARAAKCFEPRAQPAAARTVAFLTSTIHEGDDGIWLSHADKGRSVAEISLLVLALCEGPDVGLRERWVPRLSAALWSRIDAHGHIQTHQAIAAAVDAFQDYFPGQVLLALAAAVREGLTNIDAVKLSKAFLYYRHRFRNRPHFGQVSWLAQACYSWWQVRPSAEFADLAREIAEWILRFQHEKSGAFLNDHQSDTPGYTTALYLEGIASVASLAQSAGNEPQHRRYLESCRRGLQFLDGLIVQPRDVSFLPNPAMAIGGLRRSARSSEVCVDFVQHYLAALVEIRRASQV